MAAEQERSLKIDFFEFDYFFFQSRHFFQFRNDDLNGKCHLNTKLARRVSLFKYTQKPVYRKKEMHNLL